MIPYILTALGGYLIGSSVKQYASGGQVQLLAPNGKTSNLTPEQYKLVRTPEFKAWFGDWENDPENSSKVVDENGEPMVMYHGAYDYGFTIFSKKYRGISTGAKSAKKGFFFYDKEKDARMFSKRSASGGVYKVFLNIKKPNIKNYNSENKNADKDLLELINYYDFDGAIALNIKDGFEIGNQYIAFEPNQIKLADGTNTTFDGSNPDIRYERGGEITVSVFNRKIKRELPSIKREVISYSGEEIDGRKTNHNIRYARGGLMPNDTFIGKRIKLIAMNEEPYPVEPNTMGTIQSIDGIGQIHVKWDNGRSLAVVPEIDEYEIIE